MRKIIANTTPLIALAEIGQLDILRLLYDSVIIPEAVLQEIIEEPAKSEVHCANWIQTQSIQHPEEKQFYRARLHAGEVEVLILAREIQADLLLIDDNTAKKAAKFAGFSVTGTLGILLRAKRAGLIHSVAPLLNQLSDRGFYVVEKIRTYVLNAAEEGGEELRSD